VSSAARAADAHRQITELRREVALIDIDVGGESGFELARQLHANSGQVALPHLILILA
jgi:DNA-binding response OmpR family regulator